MSSLTSGFLRNRFRLVLNSGLEAPGFVWDQARMAGSEVDQGTAVGVGAYWDGSNEAFEDRTHLIWDSGNQAWVYRYWRSNLTRGLPFLIAGIGDNDDLELSGIVASGNAWQPAIATGTFFDLDTPCYMYSDHAIEVIYSGQDQAFVLDPAPSDFAPISVGSYIVDEWGRVRPFQSWRQKHSFTPIDESISTLTPTPGNPPVYESRYTSINWGNVNSGNLEFILDKFAPGIVLNQEPTTLTYGASIICTLSRVPWSQEYCQLPIIPVATWEDDTPTIHVFAETARSTTGVARLKINESAGAAVVTLSGYVRVSGSLSNTTTFIPVIGSTSGFLASGILLIDDDNLHQEVVGYSVRTATGFSGVTRGLSAPLSGWWGNVTPAITHRDGAQVRQCLNVFNQTMMSGLGVSGIHFSGLPYTGDVLISYSGLASDFEVDQMTGLMHIPPLSGVHRCTVDFDYTYGILVCYEPSGIVDFTRRPTDLDLNPLTYGNEHGILWASMFPLQPAKIKLEVNRGRNDDGTVGPIYAGNDFLVVNAKVLTNNNAPVPQADVTLVLENPINVGLVNAENPGPSLISRTSDGSGTARFVYTPPDSIHGLGYCIPSGNLTVSGMRPVSPIPIEELWTDDGSVSGLYKCLAFSIYNDDEYTPFSFTSGIFDCSADGRFELITVLSGTSATTGYTIWKAVQPAALLDSNGLAVTASGSRISEIVFPPYAIPSGTDIGAYFVSVERRISLGAMIPGSNIASDSVEVVVGIPRFMTGEFLFGEIDAPDTSAFDSLAYLTVNPFELRSALDSRSDPRLLGHVFRVQGSSSSLLRHKFYLGIDYAALAATSDGRNQIRKMQALRHRFILET